MHGRVVIMRLPRPMTLDRDDLGMHTAGIDVEVADQKHPGTQAQHMRAGPQTRLEAGHRAHEATGSPTGSQERSSRRHPKNSAFNRRSRCGARPRFLHVFSAGAPKRSFQPMG
jgi:hypothetical protein